MSPRPTHGSTRSLALALAAVSVLSACSSLSSLELAYVADPSPGATRPAELERDAASPAASHARRAGARARSPDPLASPATPDQPEASSQPGEGRQERQPRVRTIRLRPRPAPGPFRMDLYRAGDFVHQATKDWCVAGSVQTMMNIIDTGKPDRSTRLQRRLYLQGRELSPNRRKLGPIGVDLIGWAELLNTNGYGPYVVDGAATRRGAIRKAARALRLTNRPVGLVTWRGAHSWVMSGFTASADPAWTDDFRVRKIYVQDVWYPYVSTIWGASRPPDSLVPVAALAEDYLPYARPRARYPRRDGRFMLILPVLPKDTVVR